MPPNHWIEAWLSPEGLCPSPDNQAYNSGWGAATAPELVPQENRGMLQATNLTIPGWGGAREARPVPENTQGRGAAPRRPRPRAAMAGMGDGANVDLRPRRVIGFINYKERDPAARA